MQRIAVLVSALLSPTLLSLPSTPVQATEGPEYWRSQGETALRQALQRPINTRGAKNIILFVGDGLGVSTVTAARILEGQLRGDPGEENSLSFESLPYMALAKTYNTNQQTPDSAGTMTAIMTGVKTRAGIIGLDQRALRQDCAGASGRELPSLLQQFENSGRATGLVTTTRLTHATPAATFAHTPERSWEDDHTMSARARAEGCKDIARQLVDMPHGNGLEVALGGGRRNFLPSQTADPEYPSQRGDRDDGRDLTRQWLKQMPNAAYVWNLQQFSAINPATTDHLLGLFESSHMHYESDRAGDRAGEPSLSEMTRLAIRILRRNPKGFFLMVEGGRIDHAHHAGNAYRALHDTIEFSRAVATAQAETDSSNTLLIVTADHSHVFTLAGYPTRGNPILGKVIGNDGSGQPKTTPTLALDRKPYTTAGYLNGKGYGTGSTLQERYRQAPTSGRQALHDVDTEHPDYFQEALIPMNAETHGAEDVAIYASGPWAHLFTRTEEQSFIYHVMYHASLGAGANPPAEEAGAAAVAKPE